MIMNERHPGRADTAVRCVVAALLLTGLLALATACRGGGNATPPPATIIRVTSEVPAATQPVVGETLPMPPTLPELPTAEGGSEPYPLPSEDVAQPEGTPSPIVYPDN